MKVVNLRKEKYTVYIGRGSILGNPFVLGKDGNRDEVISKYEKYLRNRLFSNFLPGRKTIREAIYNLSADAILGCYCKPKACHGDIIIKIWKELHETK